MPVKSIGPGINERKPFWEGITIPAKNPIFREKFYK